MALALQRTVPASVPGMFAMRMSPEDTEWQMQLQQQLNEFIVTNNIDDKASAAIRSAEPAVQQLCMDGFYLKENARSPSAILTKLINSSKEQVSNRRCEIAEQVEAFIAMNGFDEKASSQFRAASPVVQLTILDRLKLHDARNPNAKLMGLLKNLPEQPENTAPYREWWRSLGSSRALTSPTITNLGTLPMLTDGQPPAKQQKVQHDGQALQIIAGRNQLMAQSAQAMDLKQGAAFGGASGSGSPMKWPVCGTQLEWPGCGGQLAWAGCGSQLEWPTDLSQAGIYSGDGNSGIQNAPADDLQRQIEQQIAAQKEAMAHTEQQIAAHKEALAKHAQDDAANAAAAQTQVSMFQQMLFGQGSPF